MSDHNMNTGDSTLAGISMIATLLFMIGIGTIAAVIGILAGTTSLIINWPKLKARFQEMFNNKKQAP